VNNSRGPETAPTLGGQLKDYWNKRAIVHDMDAVGHIGMDQQQNEIIFGNFISTLRRACNGTDLGMIVDLGCGVGRWKSILGSYGVYAAGVDFSREMLQRNPSSEVFVSDICTLPFDDKEFDTAFICTVLQHLVDDEMCVKAIEEAQRVSKRLIMIEAMCNWTPLEHIAYRQVPWYLEKLGRGVKMVRKAYEPHYLVWWEQ